MCVLLSVMPAAARSRESGLCPTIERNVQTEHRPAEVESVSQGKVVGSLLHDTETSDRGDFIVS